MKNKLVRQLGKSLFGLRLRPTRLHRLIATPHMLMRFGCYELLRIVYYQPLFEAQCQEVQDGVRLELCPDSKLPLVHNVELHLGRDVCLSARSSFSGARNSPVRPRIEIGDFSYLGHRAVLRAGTEIRIGRHVKIASNVLLAGDPGHPLDALSRRTEPAPADQLARIVIEDDAWLAYNVTVVGNVCIGRGAVVAANSVVTRDVPPYALVAGNPARVIRNLTPSEREATTEPEIPMLVVDRPLEPVTVPPPAPQTAPAAP
jgi:acetyltransferase-like isoleucine patch superfamily enzyme